MDKAALESRLAALNEGRQKAQEAAVQAQANVHAFEGAIVECKFWLSQFTADSVELVKE